MATGKVSYNSSVVGAVSTGTPLKIADKNVSRSRLFFQNLSSISPIVLYFLYTVGVSPTVGTTTPAITIPAGANYESDARDVYDCRNEIWVSTTGSSIGFECQVEE